MRLPLATCRRFGLFVLTWGLAFSPAPQAFAAGPVRNHAPTAPVGLTVNDRVDPLAVDGAPQFGWLPQDIDGGETQSAYQVVVRDGDGTELWNSGKVSSSAQSWTRYGGSALKAGTSYTWRVRTWDHAGAESAFSDPASFGAGLGDDGWSGAQWIRRPATGNDATNEWTAARKIMTVSSGSPVTDARVYVASMGDWEANVGGHVVQRSSSYEYAGEGYYDVSKLDGITAGQKLPVGVVTHYWNCKCQGRANGPSGSEGPSGLLVKVVVDHKDGTRDLMVSDGSWKVHRYEPQSVDTVTYRNSDSGDRLEYYDATKEMTGWDTAPYDDSSWPAATAIGPHPRPNPVNCASYEGSSSPCAFTHLSALEAHLSQKVVHPVSLLHLPDGTVFADFGKVYAAVPSVRLQDGAAGRQLTFTTSYRRNNSTLTAAVSAGATTLTLAVVGNVHVGDRITVDAPADGYGAGDPETHTVQAVDGTTVTLDGALLRGHAKGSWVENSRAGTSKLDTQGSNMHFYYTEKDGAQTAQPFTYWGWRYLQISDPVENLTTEDISAVVQNTDAAHPATFSSSDATLDGVFELMQRSALQSSQNVFLDTPTREKGQFLGDSIDESFATMSSSGERSLTRQAIVAFMNSQARYWNNGALNSVYPNGDAKRDIPDYTEMFPEWVLRYYQTTGDKDLLRQALPVMKNVADYIWGAVDNRGLVADLPGGSGDYQYGIIDWPAPMRYGYVTKGNVNRTVVNALGVGALRSVATAAEALGDTGTRTTYDDRADHLTAAMRDQLRDPGTGAWSDGLDAAGSRIDHFGEHSQSFPVAYGIADSSEYAALGDRISELGMQQGPMTLRTLLEALRITDRPDTLVKILTDPSHDGPAQVLSEGGSFLWEQWTPGCSTSDCTGTQVSQSSSESFSHGWGGAGVNGVLEGVLGLTVTSPGAETVRITPADKGLTAASGTQWTERGEVGVDWHRTRFGVNTKVDIPVNVTATVALPVVAGGMYHVTGQATYLGIKDGKALYQVGSGKTKFHAAAGG
ncbi:alpha-L-rhamnosidase-related protein [Streptomyces sp. NBC_01320]|uniref:alpha-L-rhamnosidase-related protein n=1 Tax=Streptomyces sp. NBC_01320 TaxID=2903824 RepID=UPI002E0D151A|nr:alpha-L-rhamnosidase N-terminal domain-containing protein [Streptomyces sp. NBC_01320]